MEKRVRRRVVLMGLTGIAMSHTLSAHAQEDAFAALLAELDRSPELVEGTWALREVQSTRAVGHGQPSQRRIHADAIDMIVRLEVSSSQRYERLYRRPIWPGGESGVTIGIGYDLRFATADDVDRDWAQLLDPSMVTTLKSVLGLRREVARDALNSVQSVDVPWAGAYSQFIAYLPYTTRDTENAFPNCQYLNDQSFGALVSLIYNRGASMPPSSNRRREMREIRDLMGARNFTAIPAKLREMKRLWPEPAARGLVIRRELEALLFERGLTSSR